MEVDTHARPVHSIMSPHCILTTICLVSSLALFHRRGDGKSHVTGAETGVGTDPGRMSVMGVIDNHGDKATPRAIFISPGRDGAKSEIILTLPVRGEIDRQKATIW